jgi:acyl CoA:acetate/3-ketoacid CoA transferase
MPFDLLDSDEAVDLIPNGATVAVSGGGFRVVPHGLIESLAQRFERTGSPSGLTVIAIAMVEHATAGKGGAGTGLNRLAIPGMMRRVITSSFSRTSANELNVAITSNQVEAYNFPMGTIVQWLRATSAGRRGFATPVGIGTFVDPRIEGGRFNDATTEDLCRIVELDGEEVIYYPRLPVDVALIKASAADERGNLFYDRESFDHGTRELAFAAHQSGGKVIVEVNRIVPVGSIHPRMGRVPGGIVDAVVVRDFSYPDEQAPWLSGAEWSDMGPPSDRNLPRDMIARLVVERLPRNAVVNLGAGIPMYDVPVSARAMGRDDIYFTVEQGPMGGWPQAGGVARNAELICDQDEVFQFYEGGGPEMTVLAFGEVDRHGNINVSRLSGLMPGCGGFINIAHGIQNLIFCGTLTSGGLDLDLGADKLAVRREGRIRRFVPDVQQVTFNAKWGLSVGKTMTVVTERATFAVTSEGLILTAIAPGIDIERDVMSQIDFAVRVAPEVATYPARLLRPAGASTTVSAAGS